MIIIIQCDKHEELHESIAERMHFASLPILNRSIVWHMIEQCVSMLDYDDTNNIEIERIICMTMYQPHILREHIDSFRWGISVEIMTYSNDEEAYFAKQCKELSKDNKCLYFNCLQIVNPQEIYTACKKLCHSDNEIGYMLFDGDVNSIKLLSLHDVYAANMTILQSLSSFSWLILEEQASTTRKSEKGEGVMHIGRNCTIHENARLHAPCIIGSDCTIAQDCVIGPYAILGCGCIMDNQSCVEHGIVSSHSYIAPLVTLRNSFCLAESIVNMDTTTCVLASDFIMQEDSRINIGIKKKEFIRIIFHRVFALCAIILCSPILCVQYISAGFHFGHILVQVEEKEKTLQCHIDTRIKTVPIHISSEKAFACVRGPILRYLPALLDVFMGKIALIGPAIHGIIWKQEEKTAGLSMLEQSYKTMQKGLIPPYYGLGSVEQDVQSFSNAEKITMIAWYAKHASLKTDCKILWGLMRCFVA